MKEARLTHYGRFWAGGFFHSECDEFRNVFDTPATAGFLIIESKRVCKLFGTGDRGLS